jgi:hypothetical protein
MDRTSCPLKLCSHCARKQRIATVTHLALHPFTKSLACTARVLLFSCACERKSKAVASDRRGSLHHPMFQEGFGKEAQEPYALRGSA